jgi:hypothetical protein
LLRNHAASISNRYDAKLVQLVLVLVKILQAGSSGGNP